VAAATKEHLAAGVGIRKTARALGVGSGTVQRIKAELAARARLTMSDRRVSGAALGPEQSDGCLPRHSVQDGLDPLERLPIAILELVIANFRMVG
jgi:hypothetical protein